MSADDRLAIMEQIARYSHAWDARDTDAYIAVFAPDAVFEMFRPGAVEPELQHVGRDAIREWAAQRHQEIDPASQSRANNTGVVFEELTADRAKTHTMLLRTDIGPEDRVPRVTVSGAYDDEWRRLPEGWRLVRRTLRLDL